MIKINLIKSRAFTAEELKKLRLYFYIILGSCIILTGIMVLVNFSFSSKLKSLQQEYDKKKEEIKSYETKYSEIKKIVSEISKDINLIKQVSQKSVLSYKLKIISECLPDVMFIENFNFEDGKINLDIYVLRNQVENVKQFTNALQEKNVFKDINVTSGQMMKLDGEEFFTFKITFKAD